MSPSATLRESQRLCVLRKVPNVVPLVWAGLVLLAPFTGVCADSAPSAPRTPACQHESLVLPNGDAPITLNLAYRPGVVPRHPAILMLGSLPHNHVTQRTSE